VVPKDDEYGAETWEENSNHYSGNAGVWTTFSADPELGIVYLPTEASTHDWYGGHRLGDNLFSSSLVALDVRTGLRRWHFQIVHHDVWDFDIPTAPILVDINVNGEAVPAVAQITKQGWVSQERYSQLPNLYQPDPPRLPARNLMKVNLLISPLN
jgi:quinoprotein glucose dehydrogenase